MDLLDATPLRQARALQPLSDQRRDRTDRARPASMLEKIGARWHKARITRSEAKTPQPPTSRPKVRLRDGDVEAFRNLAHSVVSRTLAHECEYRRQGCPEPDAHEWKLVKRHNGLRVYKCKGQQEFQPSLSQENGLARARTAFCAGTMDGPLEDVLYGLHAKTRREMHVSNTFLSKGHVACAVLSVIECGSNRNPFKQLALKWILLAQTFGDTRPGNYRDVCTIESMGAGVDAAGEAFGYRLVKSVDLAEYPQLATSSDVIRAKMTMCCIFRQDPHSRNVRVYSKGMLDMGEDAPSFLSNSDATCNMMLSIASATEVAEAKRLTLLALQRAEYSACFSQRTCDESQAEDSFRDTDTITSPPCAGVFDPRGSFVQKAPSEPCSVCGKKPSMSKLVRASYRSCNVCKQRVCHKCYVKRRLFSRADLVVVNCCKICIIASKRLRVDPRDPCPMLS